MRATIHCNRRRNNLQNPWLLGLLGTVLHAGIVLGQESETLKVLPAQAPTQAPGQPSKTQTPTKASGPAFPHPVVTEVLFNVPRGVDGDANKDGKRSPTGDEFVELMNPHDQPINLKGYRLSDGTTIGSTHEQRELPKQRPATKKTDDDATQAGKDNDDKPHSRDDAHFTFTFPDLTLEPGEIVVVFNGFESSIPGKVGTAKKAAQKSEEFDGAYVFSAQTTSQFAAFSNQHDVVQLIDAEGRAVATIRWDYRDDAPRPPARTTKEPPRNTRTKAPTKQDEPGEVLDKRAEEAGGKVENLPNVRSGSVQRRTKTGGFVSHMEAMGVPASPGTFEEHQ